MLNALANLATRRSRTVVVAAVLASVLAGALGGGVASRLDPYGADDPATESVQADNRLDDAGFQHLGLIALVRGVDVSSPQTKHRVESLASRISQDSAVGRVNDYYDTGSQAFVSKDGRSTYLAVTLKPTDDKARQDAAKRIADRVDGASGVTLGGPALAQEQVNNQVESDLRRAEMLAFPFLFGLSLLFFRSGVAALLPPLIGGLAIVGTFLMLRVASELTSVSIFALNLVTGLGLGLAIDYSLFMVSRYREEIARSGPGPEAMRRTLATAGRTIVFSSLTVAAALASLLIFPQRFLYSMGLGGSMVALIAAGLALVVLPAILALLGTRVNSLAPAFLQRRAEREARPAESGFWYRLSRFVMRRPGPIAIASATFLIALGIPFWGIKFTSVDATVLPTSASARQVDAALKTDFPPHRDSPIELAVSRADRAQLEKLSAEARRVPGVAAVNPPQRLAGGVSEIDVISKYDPLSDRGQEVATALRDMPTGSASVEVTGFTAHFMDTKSSLVDHLPIALAIVVITTFMVLFVMTGSVVLPIKALVMNVLTLSAVFGILVLIFQDGRLQGLLGYTSQGAIETTMPLLLFAVAFGLSTDYGVFLLSRIKEARDGGASDSEAVAIGLERTGRIVTAAALLFAVAIGAFVTSEIIFIKENGLGTALAVLIDASIVRALLVPSLMELLGKWNWWAPRPLRRLHARIGLSHGDADLGIATKA
ncbi:MAG: MMPL family transporter [Actinobacteria bacterium]|nr:MAG: MMPL family transporter [Actinomycetota bacterium]